MPNDNVLIYLLRRDLRVTDNPILHALAAKPSSHTFTHLMPLYVFQAKQMEISGLIPVVKDAGDKVGKKAPSPYGIARSKVGGYWRCGPYRARFILESVQNMKKSLESLGSGLAVRAGMPSDVLSSTIEGLREKGHHVGAVWAFEEEGSEERQDESDIAALCEREGVDFQCWSDEKYFVDDRDLVVPSIDQLPDVFTTYRKDCEPLRERPRPSMPKPEPSSLPPFIEPPPQLLPFVIPADDKALEAAILAPLKDVVWDLVKNYEAPFDPCQNTSVMESGEAVQVPKRVVDPDWKASSNPFSCHPFQGGEDEGHKRLRDLFSVRNATLISGYNSSRNGLVGTGYSTKLSAYLSQGCLTARQVHEMLVRYEDGTDDSLAASLHYGRGENDGSRALRTELLWRDYMRLCARKYKDKLFDLHGFQGRSDVTCECSADEGEGGCTVVKDADSHNTVDGKSESKDSKEKDNSDDDKKAESGESSDLAARNGSDAGTEKGKEPAVDHPEAEAANRDKGKEPCVVPLPGIQRPRKWKTAQTELAAKDQNPDPFEIDRMLRRFQGGTTGLGLIDASQRELLHTGYTSNRARQNVASFLAKHLEIDWRYGAEWYEMLLVDYDVCSNWANWQYMAGVGNDPRGANRIFNPVKQAFDYDFEGQFVRAWLPEVKYLESLEHIFQMSSTPYQLLVMVGLETHPMAAKPLKRIEYFPEGKPPHRRDNSGNRGHAGSSASHNRNRHRWQYDGSMAGMSQGFSYGPGHPPAAMPMYQGPAGPMLAPQSAALFHHPPMMVPSMMGAMPAMGIPGYPPGPVLPTSGGGYGVMSIARTPASGMMAPAGALAMPSTMMAPQWPPMSMPDYGQPYHMQQLSMQSYSYASAPVPQYQIPAPQIQSHPQPAMPPWQGHGAMPEGPGGYGNGAGGRRGGAGRGRGRGRAHHNR